MSNDYGYQKQFNIAYLLKERRYEERRELLKVLVKAFEAEGVEYASICSFNLYLRDVIDEFHDFDFLVDAKSINKVQAIMKRLGAKLVATGGNGYCESDYYFHYQLGRCDIDIISGFRIYGFGSQIYYAYNESEVEYIDITGEVELRIPMVSLEIQLLLYAMMEDWQPVRGYKRRLIFTTLLVTKVKFCGILRRYLYANLPEWVNGYIVCILNNQ